MSCTLIFFVRKSVLDNYFFLCLGKVCRIVILSKIQIDDPIQLQQTIINLKIFKLLLRWLKLIDVLFVLSDLIVSQSILQNLRTLLSHYLLSLIHHHHVVGQLILPIGVDMGVENGQTVDIADGRRDPPK